MPSTYSNLKIELIATGEQSGTWGVTTNTNLGTALEEAITGSADVTFTNGNDTTITLTDTNAAQAARNLRLNLIGSSTGAQNLILGSGCQIEKLYLINNTLGHTITVKNTTGTGIAVPAGKKMVVYNDGTNVVNAVDYFGSLSVDITGGTINNTVIGGSTPAAGTFTQVNITGQGDLRLEDTTGGEYVAIQAPGTLASSYTLTLPVDDGTNGQALITDGSGNLSWSTAASGDVYGPASATDNAIARFDLTTGKLIKNSVVTIADTTGNMAGVGTLSSGAITTTGVLTLPAGTVSAPAITTTGDTNTGIYFPAADTIAFTEGGVEAMRINSSGNVGIGDSSPSAKVVIRDSSDFKFIMSKTGASAFEIAQNGTSGTALTVQDPYPLIFGTNNAERMRIDSSGNVGIGTSSPASKLHISGGSTNIARIDGSSSGGGWTVMRAGSITGGIYNTGAILGDTTSGLGLFAETGYDIRFYTNGSTTERMRITSAGRVGIGTSSPAHTLDVQDTTSVARFQSTTGTQPAYIYVANTAGDFYFGRDNSAGSTFGAAAYSANIYANGAYPMIFWTNSAQRMRIDSSGFLCLGTTSKNADGLLSISADSSLHQGITIKDLNAGNNIFYIYFQNSSGGGAGRIEHTGSTTVSYVTSSDARLKTNIVDSSSAQPIIESIKIREFDWVSGEHQRFGVVAQELIDVAPEAVSVGRKEDDSWGVDYSKLVPHLIKYVQELNAKVEAQAAEIAALKKG